MSWDLTVQRHWRPAGGADRVGRLGSAGFTLIEVIVVLVVMIIAAGMVAPALLFPEREAAVSEIADVLRQARAAAANRGETLYVRLGTSGDWLIEGSASATAEGSIATGSLSDYGGPAATIIVSPVGTCAFDVRSTAAWEVVPLDPMTCEIVRS